MALDASATLETEALQASEPVLPAHVVGAYHRPWTGGDVRNLDFAMNGTVRNLHQGCGSINATRGAARIEFGYVIVLQ